MLYIYKGTQKMSWLCTISNSSKCSVWYDPKLYLNKIGILSDFYCKLKNVFYLTLLRIKYYHKILNARFFYPNS